MAQDWMKLYEYELGLRRVAEKELFKSQATATRLRGLLMRLRELEMYAPAAHDPGECPDCDLAREIDRELADDND